MRNLHYIAIEGTIGVGKTSLANLLSERLKAKLVLEEFEGNPFLSDFYEDPERHAFQTQLWFLIQRYKQQQELRQVDMFQNLVITDYMLLTKCITIWLILLLLVLQPAYQQNLDLET